MIDHIFNTPFPSIGGTVFETSHHAVLICLLALWVWSCNMAPFMFPVHLHNDWPVCHIYSSRSSNSAKLPALRHFGIIRQKTDSHTNSFIGWELKPDAWAFSAWSTMSSSLANPVIWNLPANNFEKIWLFCLQKRGSPSHFEWLLWSWKACLQAPSLPLHTPHDPLQIV